MTAKKQKCGSRRRFRTQPEAVAHVKHLREIGELSPRQATNCYRCDTCGFYHWSKGRFNRAVQQ